MRMTQCISWVATRRGLSKPVSSSPPFKTGRAAFTAPGLAPAILLRGTQGSRRRIAGAKPGAVKAARPVLNGGDEETGLDRPRLVATQLMHCVMRIARDQPVAAGRVRVELATGLHGEVGGLLHRLDRKVPCYVDHDATLTAHPGDNGRPIFVVMAPPGLAFLAAPPWRAAQRFRPARLGLSLVSGGVIEVIDKAFYFQ